MASLPVLPMTLDELNQVWAKTGQENTAFREETLRLNVILPYNPLKAVKAPRGRLSTVFLVRKNEGSLGIGKLFGYLHNGKFFCRAQLYKDTPERSAQEVISGLKKQYPAGKVFRNITEPIPFTQFEYLSDEIYVFTNEEGVYYCEPYVLSKAVREALQVLDAREAKDLEDVKNTLR
jgi:hypothetical protein